MLSDDMKDELKRIHTQDMGTTMQLSIIDKFLPKVESLEKHNSEMLEIILEYRSQYINCKQCLDYNNEKECKKCKVRQLDNLIEKNGGIYESNNPEPIDEFQIGEIILVRDNNRQGWKGRIFIDKEGKYYRCVSYFHYIHGNFETYKKSYLSGGYGTTLWRYGKKSKEEVIKMGDLVTDREKVKEIINNNGKCDYWCNACPICSESGNTYFTRNGSELDLDAIAINCGGDSESLKRAKEWLKNNPEPIDEFQVGEIILVRDLLTEDWIERIFLNKNEDYYKCVAFTLGATSGDFESYKKSYLSGEYPKTSWRYGKKSKGEIVRRGDLVTDIMIQDFIKAYHAAENKDEIKTQIEKMGYRVEKSTLEQAREIELKLFYKDFYSKTEVDKKIDLYEKAIKEMNKPD